MTAVLATATALAQDAPAFPGAEGHGRYTTGGRGGKIVHVTNLNDSGTGSLRAAVNGSAKKTVVFDVSGIIALKSELKIGDNTTIAGQTAPSPGITIRYYTVRPGANNIIRFIRCRLGEDQLSASNSDSDGADAIWQRQVTGLILDHCSFSWSIDEVASFYDNNNFTMQWCTAGESLNNSGHSKGKHGYGGIWGGKLASFHHNMICHVTNRAPRFCGARYEWSGYTGNKLYSTYKWSNAIQAENVDFRNCVVYNAGGSNACYGGPGGGQVNIVNNYYKAGPAKSSLNITQVSVAASGNSSGHPNVYGMTSRYYINGNTTENSKGKKTLNRDWDGVTYDDGTYALDSEGNHYSTDTKNYYADDVPSATNSDGERCIRIKMDEPAPIGEVTTHTAANAFKKVLAYGGASLYRDEIDTRYMEEAENGTATYTGSVTGTAGLIDKVADIGGYNLGSGSRPDGYDTDGDGMPDTWETANGLDPNDSSDANTYTLDTEKKWYTNLEVYLNSVVEDIMKAGNTDSESSVDEYYPACNTAVISSATVSGNVLKIDYYTLGGVKLKSPAKGISIRKITYRNGSTSTSKVIKN